MYLRVCVVCMSTCTLYLEMTFNSGNVGANREGGVGGWGGGGVTSGYIVLCVRD